MKMKLSEVLNINNLLKAIIDNDKVKIDPLFKFKLLGIMKSIESDVINFETIRNEKIREYGKSDEEGVIRISTEDEESMKKFTDDMNSVINSDVDVNFSKLKPTDVFDKGLPAEYLIGLYSIIEE